MPDSYRIDFTITRRRDGEADYTEIGFGSSDSWGSPEQAVHGVESVVQNRMWEISEGMPDPAEVT